ncbi:TNF receptor-associated factor 5-like isoform X2 [Watersipora subatra]|uniref:TNF receptor-associated factor 5-like isoform X2 n=1 Tax=Watersipora subatra TaxID=2589382 RepID=UPI00355C48D3
MAAASETTNMDIEQHNSVSSSADEFSVRPVFVRTQYLIKHYVCRLCQDILVQPQQTICGRRICKACIDRKFGSENVIPCPMPHDDIDEDELAEEPCQETGLHRNQVVPDSASLRVLLREKCFCPHKVYGCSDTPMWKKLKDHVQICQFTPVHCTNAGCPKKFAKEALNRHLEQCLFMVVPCNYCGERFKRNQLEDHYGECENADTQCSICSLELGKRRQSTIGIKKVVNNKVKPLEKVVAEVAMAVKKLGDKLQVSETDGDHLVNAMRTVAHILQQIEQINRKGGMIERQIRDSGLDKVTVIESLSQSIRRINEQQNEMEKRLKGQKSASYEGVLIWRISDYKRKKSDAIRGLQMSIYSYPFYSSRYGYKICAKACLNGDELGRGKCLSLFFVLMRGEYDEHLTFPFKQRVTFTLICPSNSELDKHETFVPDQDSSSFRKPLTDMNIASGCPQFALHSEVESRHFLVSDSIYLRVKVEPSGDIIP